VAIARGKRAYRLSLLQAFIMDSEPSNRVVVGDGRK
jgi:hypothetical protein